MFDQYEQYIDRIVSQSSKTVQAGNIVNDAAQNDLTHILHLTG